MDIPPPAALRKIAREVHAMVNDPPEGIRMILGEDMSDIQAWIQGPEGTPYAGGYFRLRVQLNADFPNSPPKCFFVTKIFHPNVSKQGEVCVSTLKKDWKKTLGLKHILLVVKCLLIYPNPESALNEEAGRLLLERYDDYARHAVLMTGIHAQSAGKDAFPPPKPTGADAWEDSNGSDSLSSVSATGETDGETKEAMVAVVAVLAMKDTPKARPERTLQGEDQISNAASSASSSSSSSLTEPSSATTATTIPTKRKLGSAENRTEQESASSSSPTASCPSSSPFCSSTSTSNSHGRPSTAQQQQPRTVLTAQRNSTSTTITCAQGKTQLNLLARQTLQGPPLAHRSQGLNMLQKPSASVSDQHNSQQQQEQQLPKEELCNSSNTNHMLSPKIAHNTLLGSTTTATTTSIMTSVAVVTSRPTITVTAGTSSSTVGQHHLQSALAGSCSNSFSLTQHSTTTTSTVTTAAAAASMLRSSCLVAPHNLSSLNHVRPELHVDKKRALRRL
ncbi:hypothetical protein BGZ90_003825 [Linnemannia elongata]|nr:hypothetical protein BGZ90_003825 [Linnemannia elongata]